MSALGFNRLLLVGNPQHQGMQWLRAQITELTQGTLDLTLCQPGEIEAQQLDQATCVIFGLSEAHHYPADLIASSRRAGAHVVTAYFDQASPLRRPGPQDGTLRIGHDYRAGTVQQTQESILFSLCEVLRLNKPTDPAGILERSGQLLHEAAAEAVNEQAERMRAKFQFSQQQIDSFWQTRPEIKNEAPARRSRAMRNADFSGHLESMVPLLSPAEEQELVLMALQNLEASKFYDAGVSVPVAETQVADDLADEVATWMDRIKAQANRDYPIYEGSYNPELQDILGPGQTLKFLGCVPDGCDRAVEMGWQALDQIAHTFPEAFHLSLKRNILAFGPELRARSFNGASWVGHGDIPKKKKKNKGEDMETPHAAGIETFQGVGLTLNPLYRELESVSRSMLKVTMATTGESQWVDADGAIQTLKKHQDYRKSVQAETGEDGLVRCFFTMSCFGLDFSLGVMEACEDVRLGLGFSGLTPVGPGLHLLERFIHHLMQAGARVKTAFVQAQQDTLRYFLKRAEQSLRSAQRAQGELRDFLLQSLLSLLKATAHGIGRSHLLLRNA